MAHTHIPGLRCLLAGILTSYCRILPLPRRLPCDSLHIICLAARHHHPCACLSIPSFSFPYSTVKHSNSDSALAAFLAVCARVRVCVSLTLNMAD